MITIGSTKKTLIFDITTEGIKNKDLEFWFRLILENRSYGLKGEIQEDGRVKVVIPPVADIFPTSEILNECSVRLETVGEGKYYIKAWEDKALIKIEPKANAKLETTSVDEEIEPTVTVSISEEKEEEPEVEPEVLEESKPKKEVKKTSTLLDQVLRRDNR